MKILRQAFGPKPLFFEGRFSPIVPAVLPAVALFWLVWRIGSDITETRGGLSPVADRFSEANAIRAAEAYEVLGLGSDYGLPKIAFDKQFLADGISSVPQFHAGERMVYTHYPPGPDWMAWVLRKLFGPEHLERQRWVPASLHIASTAILAWALWPVLGSTATSLAVLLIALTPVYYRFAHGLHYQGYALSILVLEIAVSVRLFWGRAQRSRWAWAALGLLAFVQGWLSFDFFFLAVLAAVPFAWSSHERTLWSTLGALLVPLGGFVAAHLLHFMQVALYMGGWGAAITDLTVAARARSQAEDVSLLEVLGRFYLHRIPSRKNLGYFSAPISLLSPAALLSCGRPFFSWDPARSKVLFQGWLISLLASVAWTATMTVHASIHEFFITRHCFFFFVFGLLGVFKAATERASPL